MREKATTNAAKKFEEVFFLSVLLLVSFSEL